MLPPDSTTECRRGVSVVVCCHNSASRIGPTIAHLARQHVHDEWEVIVVDNGSTDDTATVAERTWREHGSPAPLRILKEPRLGSAFARELGILQSRYEYILFCDDDNWLDPRYLQLAVEIMDDKPDIGALGGACRPMSEVEFPTWFWTYAQSYAVGSQALESGDITSRGLVWGAGMVLRASVYRWLLAQHVSKFTVGRRGEQLTAGEDGEICKWLILAGYRLWYDERLTLTHYIRPERLTKEYCVRLRAGNDQAGGIMRPYLLVIASLTTTSALKRSLRLLDGIARICIGCDSGRPIVQAYNPIPWLVVDRKTRDIQLMARRLCSPSRAKTSANGCRA